MSYNRPHVNRGPSTSGSFHPPSTPASTACYQLPQTPNPPLQPWQNQQLGYEGPYNPGSYAPLDYRIPSGPLLSDYQLPSPATTSRQSISTSATYRSAQKSTLLNGSVLTHSYASPYQTDHGAWREHSFVPPYSSTQVDHRGMSYQHPDWEIPPQRSGAGGRVSASGYRECVDIFQ
jgi:hypothetical protein